VIRLPALATTLGTLVTQGFDAFYDGDLGERIAAGLASSGAPFAAADLRAHASTWEPPIATTYRGARVTTHPPNSSGLLALEILNVLERFALPGGSASRPRLDGPA
jgi:gamma-glutamyltranspeptidase/glutathione hydrolase